MQIMSSCRVAKGPKGIGSNSNYECIQDQITGIVEWQSATHSATHFVMKSKGDLSSMLLVMLLVKRKKITCSKQIDREHIRRSWISMYWVSQKIYTAQNNWRIGERVGGYGLPGRVLVSIFVYIVPCSLSRYRLLYFLLVISKYIMLSNICIGRTLWLHTCLSA